MRLVLHLISADLRRSRWVLIAWLAVAILSSIAPCVMPMIGGGDLVTLMALELPAGLLILAYPLVLLVLVVQVVQTHALVGTNAFWMTRPVPPRALLASKIILLGVVAVIVPVVIEIARMITHGVPWSAQLGVAIVTALAHALLLTLLMLGAAITPSLSRFLLLLGGMLVSLAVLLAVLLFIGSRGSEAPSYTGWSHIPDPTPGLLQLLLLPVAIAAALLLQYVERARVRTIAVAAAGVAFVLLVSNVWPWRLVGPVPELPEWAGEDAALRVAAPSGSETRPFPSAVMGRRQGFIGVRGPLTLDGLAPGFTARIGIAEASLRIGDTTLTSYRDLAPATIAVAGEPLPPALATPKQVLDVDRIAVRPWAQQMETPTLLFLDAPEFQRHAPSSGQYDARVRVALRRHAIEAVLPLSVGAVHHRDDHRVVIDAIDHQFGALQVQVHQSRATSMFDRTPSASYAFYLRNVRRREALPGGVARTMGQAENLFAGTLVAFTREQNAGFSAHEALIWFGGPDTGEPAPLVVDEAWMADAELVIVAETPAGTLERHLSIANFPLTLPSNVTASVP